MTHAASVWLTLDDLAELLRVPEGHEVKAVAVVPEGHLPGIALTIVSKDPPLLPRVPFSAAAQVMELANYRRWVSDDEMIVRQTVLREIEVPRVPRGTDTVTGARANRPGRRADEGYTPATAPVMQSFTQAVAKEWPKFPGQDLPITGSPVQGADPGDEDIHTGGPR